MTLKLVDAMSEASASTYEVIGEAFEFELAQGDVFANPVTLTIPYDERILAEPFTHADIKVIYRCIIWFCYG